MRHRRFIFLFLFFSLVSVAEARAELTTLHFDADSERCHQSASSALERGGGIANITLFIEGSTHAEDGLCFPLALELAAHALVSAEGKIHPRDLARDRQVTATASLNRPSATLAGPLSKPSIWPPPPRRFSAESSWIFLALSPDLSPHWHWIAVDRVSSSGTFRVRVWSE